MPDTDRAVAALKAAKNIVFITGAGILAEGGISTSRDKLIGAWSTHDPEKLATAAHAEKHGIATCVSSLTPTAGRS